MSETEDTPDQIENDLSQVEEVIHQNTPSGLGRNPNGGRATFESVASALNSLRQRLSRSVRRQEGDRDNNVAAAASSSSRLETTSRLQERLASAELAHSNRIPLGLLQRELSRRRSQPNIDTGNQRKSSDGEDSKTTDSDGEPRALSSSAPPSLDQLSASRRRHASSLMASRRRDEALQLQAVDRQLHSAGIEVVLLPPVSENDDTIPTSVEAQDEDVDMRLEEHLGEDDNLTLLLTESSRLPVSSSAILLASTNNIGALEEAQPSTDSLSKEPSVSKLPPPPPASQTVCYSWGSEGTHSLHDDSTNRAPEQSKIEEGRLTRSTIMAVGVGPRHSCVVTTTGQVLGCGNNSQGQIDSTRRDEGEYLPRPAIYELLSNMTRVLQVSCGYSHTAAITAGGTCLTWGSNEVGQLGHRKKSGSVPAAMIGVSRAAQVVCGNEFTCVLTTRMQLFCCGTSDVVTWDGSTQDEEGPIPPLPSSLPSLEGLPLVKVVAGARHVVALTASGSAYAWGENEVGSCSRAFPKSIHTPVPIVFTIDNLERKKSEVFTDSGLEEPFPHWGHHDGAREPLSIDPNVSIHDAACGEGYSIFLSKTGRVYVCGSNGQGQLGVPESSVLTATLLKLPEAVDTIVSVAAGRSHTVLLDDAGNVWSMGDGKHEVYLALKNKMIQKIAAGGGETVAIAPATPATPKAAMMREFSIEKSDDMDDGVNSNQAGKFRVEQLMAQKETSLLLKRISDFFGSPTVWNSLFFDPVECSDLYNELFLSSGDAEIKIKVASAMEEAMQLGLESLRKSARLIYPESVRYLLLYLQCPLFVEPSLNDEYEFDPRGDVILSLCESFLNLPFEGYKAVQQWAQSAYGPPHFAKLLVRPLIASLERGLQAGAGARSRAVHGIVTLLRWFHGAAERYPGLAPPEAFHSEAIGLMEPEFIYEDLKRWKESGKKSSTFSFAANPFLLSPSTKRTLLMIENQVEMMRAATSNLTWDRDQHQFVFDPFFVLAIDREHLLTQTLQKISAASHVELRKSLKIVFKGEDAVDAGGVLKEFMYLLSHQLFDASTGMWSTRFEDNITWFNGDCSWNDDGYYLVGVLVGLAIYNDVILDVHFPRAVFRKLLGHTLGLEDMVDAETRNGLQQLLDYEGDDVEDIFCLSFEHSWMDPILGSQRQVALKPGGAEIPVTSANREEYVMLYVKFLLVDSINPQYEAFERGVMQVLDSTSLDLLQPEELELLLVGSPDLDIDAWESACEYEGFEPDSPTIQNFWKFVRNADRDTHLQLLKFATGTSRAPIGGLGKMPFKIQRAGGDTMQLPTSHTCFNILILPDYSDYEKLEHLLGRAILECEGFGLQ